jgi:ketosteroid isomerase-like protein
MPEECATPDPADLSRRAVEAAGRRDFDGAMSFYTEDSVWDASAMGMGTFKGVETIRREMELWVGAYEEFEIEVEAIHDLGNGVVLSATHQRGRPLGSSGHLEMGFYSVTHWRSGKIVRVMSFMDIDNAHAAAELLAEERE